MSASRLYRSNLNDQVAVMIHRGPVSDCEHAGCFALLNESRPLDHAAGLHHVAIIDGTIDVTPIWKVSRPLRLGGRLRRVLVATRAFRGCGRWAVDFDFPIQDFNRLIKETQRKDAAVNRRKVLREPAKQL